MSNIKVDMESRKILFSDDLIEKIIYLIKNIGVVTLEKRYYLSHIKNNELDIDFFLEIVDKISDSIDRSIPFIKEPGGILERMSPKLYGEVVDIISKYNDFNKMLDKIPKDVQLENYYEVLEDYLNVLYDYKIKSRDLHLLNELYELRDNCRDNMSYFKTDDESFDFMNKYNEALRNGDVEKTKTLFFELQDEILKEWENFVDDIDEMTDDNFCFIGHSTNTFKFYDNFKSNYVSTSLFNQDLNDTYRFSYGFIMPAKHIVCAKSEDMFVDNNADDNQDLLVYCSIPVIDHPKKVLEELLDEKRKYEKLGEYTKVYSEVVESEFDPIGIFCFSDGTREIDKFYRMAYELQKSFPDLEVKVFDTFKNKKGVDLVRAKIKMLENLEDDYNKRHGNEMVNIYFREGDLDRYSFFFEEFKKLKESGDYDIDEVRELYSKNKEYIKFGNSLDKLFTDKYSDKERKFILENNYALNIGAILQKDMDKYSLNDMVVSLIDYVGKLNRYYPGLDEFVSAASKITIDDSIILGLKQLPNMNFLNMTKLILEGVNQKYSEEVIDEEKHLIELEQKYNNIMNELNRRANLEEEYKYYKKICENRRYYPLMKKDYLAVLAKIKDICSLDYALSEEILELTSSLRKLEENEEMLKSNSHKKIKNLNVVKVLENGVKLCKNSIVNLDNMIRGVFQGDKNNTDKKENCIVLEKYDENEEILRLKKRLGCLNSKKNDNISKLNELKIEKLYIESKVRELFDCSIDEVLEKIKIANQFVGNYDHYSNCNESLNLINQLSKISADLKLERRKLESNNIDLDVIVKKLK